VSVSLSIETIRAAGRELGLVVAAAPPELPPRLEAFLRAKARAGEYPAFTERDPARRSPAAAFPGVRSVITAALPYWPTEEDDGWDGSRPRGLRGFLSRYCRGLDYHRVLRERLTALAGRLGLTDYLVQVDASPLEERALAEASGLGSYGANCLIHVGPYGPWVFLGELLVTFEVGGVSPVEGGCRGCLECVRACPTGALRGPFDLVPDRCLSYLTQMRGTIPRRYRRALGVRVFGCDTCQLSCPSFKRLNRVSYPGSSPRLDLRWLVDMSSREFRRVWGPSAIGWRGAGILKRNALVALGNVGEEALPYIRRGLEDPRPYVRRHAAWALGAAGASREELKRAYAREADPTVRGELELWL